MLRPFLILITLSGLISFVGQHEPYANNKWCNFQNPDTSVSGIKLRDGKCTDLILGKPTNLEGDSTHTFYSKNKEQILSMTVHAGDGTNLVSIFKVKYATKNRTKYRQSIIDTFKTEKGIQLGISKAQVIKSLGKCYISKIKKDAEIISYRIESPQDSKKKLLEQHNMPIYYAVYDFINGKLVEFVFGFEYP